MIDLLTLTPRSSVTVTLSMYVPAGVLDEARTTPTLSIEIPFVVPEIVKLLAPVPPEYVNAVEESALDNVVVMFEPPPIAKRPLT